STRWKTSSGSTASSSPRTARLAEEVVDPVDHRHRRLLVEVGCLHHDRRGAGLLEHRGGPAFVVGAQPGSDCLGEERSDLAPAEIRGVVVDGEPLIGDAEGDDEVCAESVGAPGSEPLGHRHVVAAGQKRHATALLEGDGGGVGGDPGGGRLRFGAAGGVDEHADADDGGGPGPEPLQLPDGLAAGPQRGPGDQAELGYDLGADHSIFCQVAVALELEDGALRVGAEDAVDLPGVETQPVEAALELGDVVAPQHGAAEEEEAVSQAISGFVQGAPGVGADDPVGVQPPAALELQDRLAGALPELPAGVGATGQAERGQPVLDVTDRFAGVPLAVQAHSGMVRLCGRETLSPKAPGDSDRAQLRNSASSCSRAALGRAPTMRFFSTPSWKTIIVGMLITS